MKDWKPVLIISGAEGFLRRRFLKEVVIKAKDQGRIIDYVDGSQKGLLRSALSSSVLMEAETLVVISKPQKADLKLIQEHYEAGDNMYLLLLHVEGAVDTRTKFGKLVKQYNAQHREFPLPKSWDADKVAADFVLGEAKRFGKGMEPRTAKALISIVGSDLGNLHFEVLKASTLADAEGSTTIEIPHVKGSIAPLAEADVFPVIRALENKDLKRVLRTLGRIRTTSKQNPTMKVCRIIGAVVTKWLQAAALASSGQEPDEAASTLNMNPWFYKRQVLPPAMRWKLEGVVRLLHVFAQSERAVLNGHVDPWSGFLSRLAAAFEPPL